MRAILLAALLAALPALALDKAECPQPRFTGKAPPEYYDRASPIAPGTDVSASRAIYVGDGRKAACATCHGVEGDGRGELSDMFDPRPRNFRCAQTISGVPDGQLFWIIRFGSPGTSMPAHRHLSDDQLWRLVAYLRTMAKP